MYIYYIYECICVYIHMYINISFVGHTGPS